MSGMKREVIQISTTSNHQDGLHVVALCNDGILWRIDRCFANWVSIPPIPSNDFNISDVTTYRCNKDF